MPSRSCWAKGQNEGSESRCGNTEKRNLPDKNAFLARKELCVQICSCDEHGAAMNSEQALDERNIVRFFAAF